jgi:hypothetical protein
MPELRRRGFRLGTWHGREPAADGREYAIQRALYLYGVNLVSSCETSIFLRPFGYEMPLYLSSRSKSVDVVAYDARFNVYLIEVKRAENAERLADAVGQVTQYADVFGKIKPDVEAEFKKQFHVGVDFNDVVKLIVAPRNFYSREDHRFLSSFRGDVWVGYLGRIQPGAEASLLWKGSATPISVHFHYRPEGK